MNALITRVIFLAGLSSFSVQATCTPDLTLIGQTSWVQKKPSSWLIEGKDPYNRNNVFHDVALNIDGRCSFFDGKLSLDSSVYGLAYAAWQTPGNFEQDDGRSRLLVDKLQFSWGITDALRADFGKLRPDGGNFYLYSPASLLKNYYAGFKAGSISAEGMAPVYQESFWGATISLVMPRYTLSFTAAPALTRPPARYHSSSNWSALSRGNSTERYLLNWTDYGIDNHTLSASVMSGDATSVALSERYTPEGAWAFSAEMAWHADSQWRHLDADSVRHLHKGEYPSQLYTTRRAQNIELAVGAEYTTRHFSQIGLEYYVQSAGYSSGEWRNQIDLIKSLRYAGQGTFFGQIFDVYKYLMASEIYNVSSQGHLMGKHYITAWASLALSGQARLQPSGVFNMRDGSALLGLRYSRPIAMWDQNIDFYTGVFIAAGDKDTEFALFGESSGAYFGFKYHF